ncbi:protein ABHD15-like isoform X1 [Chelonoidis abingdonii]|uniref:protein ABHD15-like isoform X1 n=1 Tax=Chelonoidis abingdonii TaxID=106734 RepID=UPI0013F1D483|nr:protein ABHD15-like isoform X1 [Chelonoidis abingdonii]
MLPWAGVLGFLLLLILLRVRVWVPSSSGAQLVCKSSALAAYLESQCQALKGLCEASWPWRALPSLQTLASLMGPLDSRVHFVRTYLQLSDEGLVALDWAVGPAQQERRQTSSTHSAPVLLLVPNSFGKVTRNISKLCHEALLHGYRPVVFNRRGQNGCPLSTTTLQLYGDPADLREAIQYICSRCPGALLFAVGESTGAGLLFSYLGECGSSSHLTAAGCISPIFHPRCWFEAGCPWLWQQLLLMSQKVCLSQFATVLGEVLPLDRFFEGQSLRELEEVLFCQAQTWDLYWERNNSLRDVDEVAVPVLCICSQDDPMCGGPRGTLPFELFETNPYFFLVLTQGGGHCGFFKDSLCGAFWSHEVLLQFFHTTVDFLLTEDKLRGQAKKRGARSVLKVTQGRSGCRKESCCPHNSPDIYRWQRSYTR